VTCYTCHRGSPTPKVVPSLSNNTASLRRTIRTRWNSAAGLQGPTADDILNRYIEAVGGAQRLAALTSYTGSGHYDGFDSYHGKVTVDVYAKATGERTWSPIRRMATASPPTMRATRGSWAGQAGFRPGVGARRNLDGVKLDSALAFPGKLKQILTDVRTGFPAHSLTIAGRRDSGDGRRKSSETVLRQETGLLARMFRYSNTIVGPVPVEVDYSDYRDVRE